jgi:hypothetical protein
LGFGFGAGFGFGRGFGLGFGAGRDRGSARRVVRAREADGLEGLRRAGIG